MKIRRFFAKDMRTALSEVSKELGPDAAIVSSRRVGGGVELMAAIDYDPLMLSENRQSEPAAPEARLSAASAEAEEKTSKPARHLPDDKLVAQSPLLQSLFGAGRKAEAAGGKAGAKALAGAKTAASLPASANFSAADPDQPAQLQADTARRAEPQRVQLEFGNDPGLQGLRDELRQLRGLMQDQLQGLAWKEMQQRTPVRAMLARRLSLWQLSPRLREHYAHVEGVDAEKALSQAIAAMARDVVSARDDVFAQGGMYALVGPTGVGKTTTIAKIAARFALQHGAQNVAVISTDCYRIAAHDQLRVYARLIGCPLRIVEHPDQLAATLDTLVDKRLVLIDSAGMSQNDARLQEAMSLLQSQTYPLKRLLVLSATAQRSLLQECVRQFGVQPLSGAILTKLDEATSLGPLLSVLIESRLPLYFGCDGQRVPEDLRPMRGVQLVERARRLAEHYQEGVDEWLLAQEWHGAMPQAGKESAHVRA